MGKPKEMEIVRKALEHALYCISNVENNSTSDKPVIRLETYFALESANEAIESFLTLAKII